MDFTNIAGWYLLLCLVSLVLFQLALAFGAPMGEYAFGGQRVGKLPVPFRVVSLISVPLYVAIGGHYLAQMNLLQPLLPDFANFLANWFLVGFFGLALLMNSVSK